MVGKPSLLLAFVLAAAQGATIPDDDAPTVISRSEWGAKPAKGAVSSLEGPASHVIVHHAASDSCTNRAICQARVRSFQDYHMNTKKWSDIGYNFLVGEDGNIYEGRGWAKAGAHTASYNDKSVGICVIGNFEKRAPNSAAIEALKSLISHGVAMGKISKGFALIGHRQAASTSCPGDKLYQILQTWQNWSEKP